MMHSLPARNQKISLSDPSSNFSPLGKKPSKDASRWGCYLPGTISAALRRCSGYLLVTSTRNTGVDQQNNQRGCITINCGGIALTSFALLPLQPNRYEKRNGNTSTQPSLELVGCAFWGLFLGPSAENKNESLSKRITDRAGTPLRKKTPNLAHRRPASWERRSALVHLLDFVQPENLG